MIVYNIVLTLIDFLDSKNVLSHRNQILRLINHITLKGWDRTLKAHLTVQPASGSFFVYGLDKTFYFIYVDICGCPFCFRIDEAISYTGLCVLTTYKLFFLLCDPLITYSSGKTLSQMVLDLFRTIYMKYLSFHDVKRLLYELIV